MGQKWIFRLKTEDFVCVAQRPNIALKEKSEGKSRALSEYYSETENDQKPVGIWTELEAANRPKHYADKRQQPAGNLQKESQKRDASRERKTTAPTMQRSLSKSANGRSGSTVGRNHLSFSSKWSGLPTHAAWT